MRKLYAWVFMFAVLMSGCAASAETAAPVTSEEPSAEMFTERELDYGYEETAAVIELKDKSVTIDSEGTYIIRGSLQDGSLIVDADKSQKIQLVLDGVNINSESSAAIYVKQADKVFITLAEGSENILSNGGSFENIDENNIDGVIFSKDDLCINGTGSLKINSPADHGIVCKDSLAISGGSFDVEAASHAVSCKEDISITGANFVLNSGKDGIHAENSDDSSLASIYIESGEFVIKAAGDGISADAGLNIIGGSFNIVSGGGSAEAEQKASEQMPNGFMGGGKRGFGGPGGGPGFPMEEVPAAETEDTVSTKGIKAGGELVISGGQFVIDSADDGLHSNFSINIKGGDFKISTRDDGFHADDTLTIAAGTISIEKSYEGLEALHLLLSGGNITLNASDDGLNAAGGTDQSGMGGRGQDRFGPPGMSMNSEGTIVISGGTLYIKAEGDGIDANGSLEITGGDTVVCTPTRGDTATMDYDVSAAISGGSFIGTGAYGMAQSFSESEQAVIAVSVGNCSAGTEIKLTDGNGKELVSYSPEYDFAVVIISNEQLIKGESYTLTVGTLTGEIEAY